MDPFRELLGKWEREREIFTRSGSGELIRLSETHTQELLDTLSDLSEAKVPYRVAEELTGFALGSLKNTLRNVGTRNSPAFRLGDLPFKAGYASPAKMVAAASILRAIGEELRYPRMHEHGGSSARIKFQNPSSR